MILSVQKQLQPLVEELVRYACSKRNKKLPKVTGVAKPLGQQDVRPRHHYSQVYQVVSQNGFYYNISKSQLGPLEFTNFPRGAYIDRELSAIEFTTNDIRFGFYPRHQPC